MNDNQLLRQQLAGLLQKSYAHVNFEQAIEGLELKSIGAQVPHLPYTIWQLAEHIRIVQQDMLNFSEDKNYQPLNWPEDYWPKEAAPANQQEWQNTLAEIKKSQAAFTALINDEQLDLLKPFPHGEGQSLFREAVMIIDHLSYHTGQIVLIRRLLENWKG
ncbi:DinB family protein [uncultured Mucilaginibacter sp.]|uniref:DinB family protein n=1 Tax=uncultured Mucilaginibacter sp. TaxID=797541 RepID=UPI002605018D|nr:DinB family protein [uncultured Mucilaginibacter sp.]